MKRNNLILLLFVFKFMCFHVQSLKNENNGYVNNTEAVIDHINYQKIHYHQLSNHSHSHWRDDIQGFIHQTDGLLNQDVVMIITSTIGYMRQRIIPSIRTWMRLFMHVFIVLEDTADIRLQMRFCKQKDYDDFVTTFKCDHEPLYILARQCTADYAIGKGICCKVDVVFKYLGIYRNDIYHHMKYITLADDDTYWRGDQLLYLLSVIEKSNISSLPIIGNGAKDQTHKAFPGIFNTKRCREIFTYGWYQPMIMNKAAFERFSIISNSFGLTDVCISFSVSQDVGIGIVAWLLETYHINIPHMDEVTDITKLTSSKSSLLVVHHVKPNDIDDCNGMEWPASMRYNQQLIIGCGDINQHSPKHDLDHSLTMYDLWNYYLVNNDTISLDVPEWFNHNNQYSPKVIFLDGYNQTKHYHENHILEKWKVYSLEDCEINDE